MLHSLSLYIKFRKRDHSLHLRTKKGSPKEEFDGLFTLMVCGIIVILGTYVDKVAGH